MGIPSLAVSLHVDHARDTRPPGSPHFETAVHYAMKVLDHMADHPLEAGVFLNLNVPDLPVETVKGLRVCSLGRRHYEPMVEERSDPRSRSYFWIGGDPVEGKMRENCDGWWASQGWATVTPIQLDTTAHASLPTLDDLERSCNLV